jgi:NAD+ kinase
VTASKYPFPTVSADKASTDWFSSVSRTLRWNEREKQKSFVVVEEDAETPNHREVIDSGKRERREERVADNGPNGTSGKPEQEEGQEQQQQQRSGTQVKESRNRADAQPKQPDMGGERRQKSKEKAEAGMDDPHGEEAQKDVEKEEEEEEEDDEEFDIDE